MGQKTSPVGLRLGSSRKWASSWYGSEKANIPSFGIISSRGGFYYTIFENILISLFKRYSRSKFSKSKNMAIVDFRIFKGFGGHLYGFMIYTKIIGKNLCWLMTNFFICQKYTITTVSVNKTRHSFKTINNINFCFFHLFFFIEKKTICTRKRIMNNFYSFFVFFLDINKKAISFKINVNYFFKQIAIQISFNTIVTFKNSLTKFSKAIANLFVFMYWNFCFKNNSEALKTHTIVNKINRFEYKMKLQIRIKPYFIQYAEHLLFSKIFNINNDLGSIKTKQK